MNNPLGDRWHPLRYHPTQEKLFLDNIRFPIVTAGRRSGKTERAKRKVAREALCRKTEWKENFYFLAAPTLKQAKRIYWDDMKGLTKVFWSRRPHETDLIIYTKFNGISSRIQVLGLDEPARIEGSPWNGGVMDEMRKIKKGTWETHVRPALSDRIGWCWRCGVPGGRDHYYDVAEKAGGGIPRTIPGVGVFSQGKDPEQAFYTWYSADILPANEVEAARRTLDPKQFRQEYEGSFETFQGLVYYAFAPQKYPAGNIDNDIKYQKSLPIFIGMDFNVDPMTAVLCHHITPQDGKNKGRVETHVFKGYYIPNSNTRMLAERIVSEHPETPYFTITPCQSARARQTVADIGITDRRIIEQVFREHGKTVYFNQDTRNPHIRDRVNLTNARLYHRLLRINGEDVGCKELISDLGSICYKENTGDLDLRDPRRGHISAALDYSEYRHFNIESMTRQAVKTSSQPINF